MTKPLSRILHERFIQQLNLQIIDVDSIGKWGNRGVSDGRAQGVLLVVLWENSKVGVLVGVLCRLGLFPISLFLLSLLILLRVVLVFTLRHFSADFTILYTYFSEGWIAREGVYWDLLFVGHVQPLARTLTYCKYSHGCILRYTITIATHAIFNWYRFPWSFSCAYNLQQVMSPAAFC